MIEKIGPTIYKGDTIYNTGAGGAGGNTQIFPDGVEEVESVKVINANVTINFDGDLVYNDTEFKFIGKIETMGNTPGVLYNRNSSNIVGVNNSGRLYVYSSYRNLYLPTNDYFTLIEKNGNFNGNYIDITSNMQNIKLFNKAGYQTFYPFVGRFKRFTISKTAPNVKYCDLLPVKDKINNAFGVYDIINNVLYTGGFSE